MGHHLDDSGRRIFHRSLVRSAFHTHRRRGRRCFGRAHDHAVFVDPHSVRNIDNTKQLGHSMVLVDQRWVLRICCFYE